jgi:hypothetical protein
MSTKTNIAAIAAFLGVVGSHGPASAQEGFGNYAAALSALNAQQQSETIRSSTKALSGSYGFANKISHSRHVRAPK